MATPQEFGLQDIVDGELAPIEETDDLHAIPEDRLARAIEELESSRDNLELALMLISDEDLESGSGDQSPYTVLEELDTQIRELVAEQERRAAAN